MVRLTKQKENNKMEKNLKYIGVRIDEDLYNKCSAEVAEEGINMTILVRWALKEYFNKKVDNRS